LGLNNWIKPPPPPPQTNMFCFVSKFLHLAIFVGKQMKKFVKIQGKCKQQKTCQKIGITNLKRKMLFLMNKN
jgi:hypothetical protein